MAKNKKESEKSEKQSKKDEAQSLDASAEPSAEPVSDSEASTNNKKKKTALIGEAFGLFTSQIGMFFSAFGGVIKTFFSWLYYFFTFPFKIFQLIPFFIESDFFTKSMLTLAFCFMCMMSFSTYKIYKNYEPAIDSWVADDVISYFRNFNKNSNTHSRNLQSEKDSNSENSEEEIAPSESSDIADKTSQFFTKSMEHFKSLKELVYLEQFTLKLDTGPRKILQFDMFVECDSVETAKILKMNSVKVRDYLSARLVDLNGDMLVTEDGKEQFKKIILENVNAFLEKGKAVKVYFVTYMIQ